MTIGSEDYWMTKSNLMSSVLTAIRDSVAEGGALQIALDSMDGKLDGVIDLTKLTDDETGLLAKLFTIDTIDGDGRNLLTKLDVLDGKADGKMDLNKMELMSIFYNSGTSKARLQEAVENLDGTIGTLKSSIDELVGVHEDTTAMVAYGEEDWDGNTVAESWVLISDENVKRNLLKIHNDGIGDYSRDGGATVAGQYSIGDIVFHSAPGVWERWGGGATSYQAHEEWAT